MPTLYIVATPIGNLKDITLRALDVLKEVDFILAEDTRVTNKLLTAHNIKTKQISFHEHSNQGVYKKIINLLREGKNLAYTTDAGTPGISDPGGKLIAEIVKQLGSAVTITSLPGASALTAALSLAGLPVDNFVFYGFLPNKKGRNKVLKEVAGSKRAGVLFESPYRIVKTLTALAELMAENRQMVVARELTKLFETVYRGSAKEVLGLVKSNTIKGEFVIIISKS